MAMKIKKKQSQSIFGMPLEEILQIYQQDSNSLPAIVSELTEHLKRHGLGCERIFIAPGNESKVHILKKLYNKDGSVSLEKYSPLNVAWLFRCFLAELPDPLLMEKYRATFLKTQTNPEALLRYRNMRKLLNALAPVNRTVLISVLELFRLVLHHRRKNKLSFHEFCTDLAPVLLGLDPITNASDMPIAAEVLKTLITQFPYLIGNVDEPLDDDSLPLYTKKSQKKHTAAKSRARQLLPNQMSFSESYGHSSHQVPISLDYISSSTSTDFSTYDSGMEFGGSSSGFCSPAATVVSRRMSISITNNNSFANNLGQNNEDSVVSLTDAIMTKFVESSVRSILFEPQTRITFSYETKMPSHLKRNYTTDRLMSLSRLPKMVPYSGSSTNNNDPRNRRGSFADEMPSTNSKPIGIKSKKRKSDGTPSSRSKDPPKPVVEGGAESGAESSSSASSRPHRRSRGGAGSITEELVILPIVAASSPPGPGVHSGITSEEESSGSLIGSADKLKEKRFSIGNLDDIQISNSDDSDFHNEGKDSTQAKRDRTKRAPRRASTGKLANTIKSKINSNGAGSGSGSGPGSVRDKRVNRLSRDFADDSLVNSSSTSGTPGNTTPSSTSSTASTSTIPSNSADRSPKPKPTKVKKPFPQPLDSKTIMENAPSPPKEIAPPLATT